MATHTLAGRRLSPFDPPYVIAEIGVNHEGSLDQAKRLIDLAKEGGADAAKFQTYKAGSLASKHSPAYWDTTKEPTQSQYQLFQKYDTFEQRDYEELAGHCDSVGIDFLSTPFDAAAVEFLDPLMKFFKIASADLTNVPFLRAVAGKGKPVVLSTGASTLAEIDLAVDILEKAGAPAVALLHCVLNYPTPNENAHLGMITGLARSYPDYLIGYSDHTIPDECMTTLVSAYLLGARVIEKHFTHDKTLPGNDHYHAMDVEDLKRFTARIETTRALIGGQTTKSALESEEISRKNARRSIVLTKDVPADHRITETDLTYKRPGTGISPLYWDDVIGRVTVRPLENDHVLQWRDLD